MDPIKVRGSVKNFLEKMKALDAAIPEELAEDALEMAEEVADACSVETEDEEADVLEITRDAKCGDEEEIEAKVEDAVNRALMKAGLIKDSSTRALDELEEELETKVKDEDKEESNVLDADNEEAVTVDPNKSKDSAKAMLDFVRDMKPIIASVKDARIRKMLSKRVADMAHLQTANNFQYSDILNMTRSNAKENMRDSASKAADADYEFGMQVASQFNPHYKKEG